ncbi:hypothetical protein KFK09_022296 [Dendrobium nobile]|uniref:Uncharacterized protein n=1 Tax=Dendrobium nobile TaxID=94219 RepID=A0A8T3AI86_DENNO|nr:hypothetical protein KFK09_022296 [Dendrobium nobile]
MEKSAHWHGRKKPSFSSSLLDSIYRSIDESNGGSPGPALSSTSKRQIPSIDKKWIPTHQPPANLRRHFSTSSSSDCSSFGGFSSSDADSTARTCPALTRCDRLCSDPPPDRKRQGSIRSRIRDLRNLRDTSVAARPPRRFSERDICQRWPKPHEIEVRRMPGRIGEIVH